ncbi:MAG TPA: hypothetical protein VLT59_04715, partial [Steroidobacteraceae bacterium]|nr:hypothetical protein [Steroidobacteraceae bacterium]
MLRKLDPDYDPTHRGKAFEYIRSRLRLGEHVTGLIYIDEGSREFHELAGTTDVPINELPYDRLCPGSSGLEKILARYR